MLDIVDTLLHLGYKGEIYPVYPPQEEVCGIKVFHSIKEVPRDIDIAVISTRRMMTLGLVRECIERGIKAIIITGQGFADAEDEEGKNLQDDIVRISRRDKARVVGPNSIGTANPFFNFSTSFAIPLDIEKVPIGLICQSGMFFENFQGIKFMGKGIDLVDACDVDMADCLEFFEQMEALLSDPCVDGALVIVGARLEMFSPSLSQVISKATEAFPDRSVARWPYKGWFQDIPVEVIEDKLRKVLGVAVFRTPERAIHALSKLAQYWEYLERD